MTKTAKILFILALAIFLIAATYIATKSPAYVDKHTRETCEYMAKIQAENYKDTNFKDWDWERTCILNIACSSPLKDCNL